jgi:hypothetical protein
MSTLRLPGIDAGACPRREVSRTLRVDPERRFPRRLEEQTFGAAEWVKEGLEKLDLIDGITFSLREKYAAQGQP